MNKQLVALMGVGLGAGIMYLADPTEGRRRRAHLRDLAGLAPPAASRPHRRVPGAALGITAIELLEHALLGKRA